MIQFRVTPRLMKTAACGLIWLHGTLPAAGGVTRERSHMPATPQHSTRATALPPIDAAAPALTQTATFALG